MDIENTLLKQEAWRFIDNTTINPAFDAIQSFATDDTLCRSVGARMVPSTVRGWVHDKTVSLGIQDSKLPDIDKGIAFLQEQGYRVVVRNSGGLAVVLDAGVLNLSMVLPDAERGIAIERGYETMFTLIKDMFVDCKEVIEAKEIVNSYCPGSYDLSIQGLKFAGISQRRMAKGVAVQIYLAIEGNQAERSTLIRDFYTISGKDKQTKYTFPDVKPEVMGTLSDLIKEDITVNGCLVRLFNSLRHYAGRLESGTLTSDELDLFPAYYERLIARNDKVLS
ncbi:lipoyl-[GcvH]:protein N-lipoyltransferase [Listeria welshimeri]|uniref:Lipoyl-[GcvH]:protein N-lipoyltransferase n=2 Tax=Listeria welshimeri TaxID=1643 RepID=A0A7X0T9K4_LISWE|nr:lipoyl-[GcvH]:protein N-lipoyltransferase [Listeria welshimeri]MBC1250052.1 lipoyl-[GcvH]:protein N-lipoyltransferase [Listeria welshimeri]MBC1252912.1 lipoyl-[GcvH]:protein N-lipoyltransferase [Listeria welshimeri]MBC1320351.1 lipoyl-[GcvH]:protein N-lipoyltransferase [Listeria welshimeri]MBC1324290.1 lipoyl-[GcvH]:protein N-lipoyltransferase [Listeria welshimeri]MBC1361526.1 lipoyl-[GcvH]:protein N-lipoyltransferase [Listeria welshimeri]